jgi:hypothetical protein
MVACRDVKTPLAAAHGLFQQRAIGNIALDPFAIRPRNPAQLAARPDKDRDPVILRSQLPHQIGPDESRGACDKALHFRSDCSKKDTDALLFHCKILQKIIDIRNSVMDKWLRLYAEKCE